MSRLDGSRKQVYLHKHLNWSKYWNAEMKIPWGWRNCTPRHESFLIESSINLKKGIYLQICITSSHAVTQLHHQSLVRIYSSGCPKSRQSLICITFSVSKKIIIYIRPKMALWLKLLTDALPSGPSATWKEQHLFGWSVSSYFYLEGQRSDEENE
jgi:hypothetical protein